MKKSVFLLVLGLFFLLSCEKQEKESEKTSQKDTTQIQKIDTIQLSDNQINILDLGVEDIEIEIKDTIGSIDYLKEIAKANNLAYDLIEKMYKKLSQKRIKKSEIIELLKLRDSLVNSDFAITIDSLIDRIDTLKLNKQLENLGVNLKVDYFTFSLILIYKDFLPKTLEQFPEAQELVDLKKNIQDLQVPYYRYGNTPALLDAIENCFNIYKLGEHTLLYDYLKKDFLDLFLIMVDIHKWDLACITGNCTDNMHLNVFCDIYDMFIEKYPHSPISEAMKKILDGKMSYIVGEAEYCDGGGFHTCYAVVVETTKNYVEAQDKIFHYFLNGIDIPHLFYIDSLKTAYIIYRFYPTEKEADSALNIIKNQYPSAQIKHFVYNYNKVELRE